MIQKQHEEYCYIQQNFFELSSIDFIAYCTQNVINNPYQEHKLTKRAFEYVAYQPLLVRQLKNPLDLLNLFEDADLFGKMHYKYLKLVLLAITTCCTDIINPVDILTQFENKISNAIEASIVLEILSALHDEQIIQFLNNNGTFALQHIINGFLRLGNTKSNNLDWISILRSTIGSIKLIYHVLSNQCLELTIQLLRSICQNTDFIKQLDLNSINNDTTFINETNEFLENSEGEILEYNGSEDGFEINEEQSEYLEEYLEDSNDSLINKNWQVQWKKCNIIIMLEQLVLSMSESNISQIFEECFVNFMIDRGCLKYLNILYQYDPQSYILVEKLAKSSLFEAYIHDIE
ncbi:Hypothetical_protein [Hexamita inflata]|uniref:Hypothetical_protein n=1 Tax=Hexamita inflata TaxID=28002 RepID=A0AA86PED2_9EUKA|nr:Hypothetical protein HINF_LOCUS22089 [Hexamita inflata]